LPLSLRCLLASAVLVPLLFLAGAAWYDHRRLTAEAYVDVGRVSAIAKVTGADSRARGLVRLEKRPGG
jgi:hypothetical protein